MNCAKTTKGYKYHRVKVCFKGNTSVPALEIELQLQKLMFKCLSTSAWKLFLCITPEQLHWRLGSLFATNKRHSMQRPSLLTGPCVVPVLATLLLWNTPTITYSGNMPLRLYRDRTSPKIRPLWDLDPIWYKSMKLFRTSSCNHFC